MKLTSPKGIALVIIGALAFAGIVAFSREFSGFQRMLVVGVGGALWGGLMWFLRQDEKK